VCLVQNSKKGSIIPRGGAGSRKRACSSNEKADRPTGKESNLSRERALSDTSTCGQKNGVKRGRGFYRSKENVSKSKKNEKYVEDAQKKGYIK